MMARMVIDGLTPIVSGESECVFVCVYDCETLCVCAREQSEGGRPCKHVVCCYIYAQTNYTERDI